MEKIVRININIGAAREMLQVAGFSQVAIHGTDEEVFNEVLRRMNCYDATYDILENVTQPSYTSRVSERDAMAPGGGNK